MKFTKMHGIGNDYVYINCFEEEVKNPEALAKFVSNRNFGVGSDGLILIRPSDVADFGWRSITPMVPRRKCAETASAVWENMCMITV